jgi:hypothetical protein
VTIGVNQWRRILDLELMRSIAITCDSLQVMLGCREVITKRSVIMSNVKSEIAELVAKKVGIPANKAE